MQADPTTTLKFIGRDGEDAVLVTGTRTYAVRKGETSNAQLLLPSSMDALVQRAEGAGDSDAMAEAVANVMEHYELHPTGPRLRMLPGRRGAAAAAARVCWGPTRTRTHRVCVRARVHVQVHAHVPVHGFARMCGALHTNCAGKAAYAEMCTCILHDDVRAVHAYIRTRIRACAAYAPMHSDIAVCLERRCVCALARAGVGAGIDGLCAEWRAGRTRSPARAASIRRA